jgi:hypothetical protein
MVGVEMKEIPYEICEVSGTRKHDLILDVEALPEKDGLPRSCIFLECVAGHGEKCCRFILREDEVIEYIEKLIGEV